MTTFVVGLGKIGLPTALLLARDRRVVGIDIDDDLVATLASGNLPFEDPGLRTLFDDVEGQFSARTSLDPGPGGDGPVPDGDDEYVVATPTPLREASRMADLGYVRDAMETVADALSPDDLVVLESTVPPGTGTRLVLPILRQSGVDADRFDYAYCPERAIPGNTLYEMIHNDRVVGAVDGSAARAVQDLYGFVEGEFHDTDPTTAEFVKLIENTHRDINIAAANEFAKLAEMNGIDGREAIALANRHPRVDILTPGPGVGGHCIPIDPNFLTQMSSGSQLITAARDINSSMTSHAMGLVRELVGGLPSPRIAVLGVAYKGNVADTRKTPAYRFQLLARNEGYDLRFHDPHTESFEYPLDPIDAAVAGSDCLVVITDHDEFCDLDVRQIAGLMRRQNVVDTRGVLDKRRWESAGYTVRVLGDGRRDDGSEEGEEQRPPERRTEEHEDNARP